MSSVEGQLADGAHYGLGGRRLWFTAPIVIGIIAVMLLAGVPSAHAASVGTSPPTTSGSSVSGAAELAAASASLAAGQGPADGQALACATVASSEQTSCAAVTAGLGAIGSQKWEAESAPSARVGAQMTYDAKNRYVLLFGGFNGTNYLGDSWEYSHGMWVQLPTTQSPSPRANASLAYDTKDSYVVLFGGYNGHVLGDTWKFVGGVWTQLSPLTSPSARTAATMSYDTADGYLVLFGGYSGTAALGDTWTFVAGAWTQASPSTSPSARWGSTSTFDTADNYVLLFGGYTGTTFLGDTWEYVGGQWTKLSPSTSPPARYEGGMGYDPSPGYAVLFGGTSASGSTWTAYGDTWDFVGGAWTQITPKAGVHSSGGKALPNGEPAARQSFAMTYSGVDSDVVVFGGVVDGDPIAATPSPNTQVFGATDTWTFHGGVWTQELNQAESTWAQMPGRVGAGIADDPTAQFSVGTKSEPGYGVAFGGSTAYGPNAETWIFLSNPSNVWVEDYPVTSPSARSFMGMAYDAKDGYVLLFGGISPSGTALGDTWEFLNGNWTQLHPSTSPAARYGAMMTYDVADGYILLFGGQSGSTYYSDSWTFVGGSWTQLVGSSPSARAFGGLAWDNKTGYTVLFGGTSGTAALGDTWKFLAGTWTALKLTTLPPAAWGTTFLYNAKSDDVFMFGGCTAATVNPLAPACPSADTLGTPWQFRSTWSVVPAHPRLTAIPAQPQDRFFAEGVFDPSAPTPVVLLFGGLTSSGAWAMDRWVYQSNIWNPWQPPVQPVARYGAMGTFDDRSQDALLFGGIGPLPGGAVGYLDDTWQWDTGAWGEDNSPTSPSARAFGGLTFFGEIPRLKFTAYNYSVLFGGVGSSGYLGDTWRWVGSPVGGSWTQIHPSTSPSARANMSMAYDTANNEIVLFGGQNSGGYLGDTWVFSQSGQWSQLSPSTAPSARAGAAMVYDSEDGYMVLFGGHNSGGALSDTWKFVGGVWTQLTEATSPSARYGSGIIDCPQIPGDGETQPQVVLLVGGYTGSAFLNDTWAFSGGVWTVVPSHTPGLVPFAFGAMSNDVDDGHPSLFGGLAPGGTILGEFWEFKLGP